MRNLICTLVLAFALTASAVEEPIVIADFEGRDYGAWEVTGEAFGRGPARGTLDGQMEVSGYQGRRLVNSFRGGDGATGTLTSPHFVLERPYLNFLIGGGGHAGETCMNLLVDGAVVRTATGPNTEPGGSEALRWQHWDVSELAGKEARIQIVDARTDGWGHINVDQIVLADEAITAERSRDITVEKHYLNLPVKTGAPKTWVRLMRGDEILREFDIELAQGEPAFWVSLDLSPWQGETLTLWADNVGTNAVGFAAITQAEELLGAENLYHETYRPQFHFSPMRGWNNDPNGMVYYQGEYHLFFQHNPYGWNWGNMTWGHAVSTDLVHWTELGDAIHPDALGTIFSGSAVIDKKNTTGFQTGDEEPLVCVYTYAGGITPWSEGAEFTQALAYSNDRGRSWTKYADNPVLGHINGANRDPKAFWHEPSGQWVIVLYLDEHRMGFFTSPDLKTWEMQSELKCFHECPELFTLAIAGDAAREKWVLYGAAGEYYIGEFDGKTYAPETEILPFNYGDCFYASQTFNNVPEADGRRIQIAWGRTGHPDMPFNQMMNFPVELTLRDTEEGPRLFAEPVAELENLRGEGHAWNALALNDEVRPLDGPKGGLYEIRARIVPGTAKTFGVAIGGLRVTYDTEKQELACKKKTAPLKLVDGAVVLQILVDRLSAEIFANHGRIYMPMGNAFTPGETAVALFAEGGGATVESMEVHELNPIWANAR